ncbi:hypothetical protein CFC21_057604 [Triticum aestivum]|uniref:Uncharacterized protein n=2 Tax=Triticum aestivum TaxID=4565 RepID=A0A9R1GLT3_WHEAT|nr:uncharacterized protein LOC123094820 [Triticum aestivum]KAF7048977.1 hypothetical protein CFC21_057604 [Triticum aestivum]
MCGEETSMAVGGTAVSTQMPLTGAALKHISMEIRTLLFKIEQKVAMEALLNRLAKWLPKPLDGLRDGGESCGPKAFYGWPGIEHDPDEQAGICDCRPSREWRCNFRSIYWQNGSTGVGMDQKG